MKESKEVDISYRYWCIENTQFERCEKKKN